MDLKVSMKTKLKGFPGSGFMGSKVQDVYDHVGRTRSTIRGLIKYLIAVEQDQRKKGNPER